MILFDPDKILPENKEVLRNQLGIESGDNILLYLGSLGTWYLMGKMLEFYEFLSETGKSYKFLLLSNSQEELKQKLLASKWKMSKEYPLQPPKEPVRENNFVRIYTKHALQNNKVIISVFSDHQYVPWFISIATTSICFIRPSKSKLASSATKIGESLSMGKPVIINSGWGDVDQMIIQGQNGFLLPDLTSDTLKAYAGKFNENLFADQQIIRDRIITSLSLNTGVSLYKNAYAELRQQRQ